MFVRFLKTDFRKSASFPFAPEDDISLFQLTLVKPYPMVETALVYFDRRFD